MDPLRDKTGNYPLLIDVSTMFFLLFFSLIVEIGWVEKFSYGDIGLGMK